MTNQAEETRSGDVAKRRDEVLSNLIAEMHLIHRQRRMRRRLLLGGAAAVFAMVVGTAALMQLRTGPAPLSNQLAQQPSAHSFPAPPDPLDTSAGYDGNAQVEQAASTAADDTERSAVIVEYITTRADIMDDYRAAPPGRRIERLTDQQLLDVLAELGRPAGLIRISDEMRLSRDVTDNPRDRLDDGRSRGHGFSLPPSLIIPVEEA